MEPKKRRKRSFHSEERALCPHCGERRGNRRGWKGTNKDKYQYQCMACGKYWYGEAPVPPPPAPCPYCKGHCIRCGRTEDTTLHPRRRGRISRFHRFLDSGSPPLPPHPKTAQMYRCKVCGRQNIELWPAPYWTARTGNGWRFTYRITLCLNAAAEDALARYCHHHKMNGAQAVRAIFAEASYPRFGGRYGRGKPPVIAPGTRLPPLADGRLAEYEKRRGKLFGHREVILTRILPVNLDGAAYLGLLRMMAAKKMTRQEAARCLILGTGPKFVGMAGGERLARWGD